MSQAWALAPEAFAVVQAHLRGESVVRRWPWAAAGKPDRRPSSSRGGAVGVLSLKGLLMPEGGALLAFFGGTSLRSFRAQLAQLDSDPSVQSIVVDVDSPGGLVFGVTETAAALARTSKPVVAVVSGLNASAAYWISSNVDRLIATPAALVGSIGVFVTHTDLSGALEREGVRVSYVSQGKFKTELAPTKPLSDAGRDELQRIVDADFELFVRDVARGRGVSPAGVRNGFGEGRVLSAPDALRAGMIDAIGAFEDGLSWSARTRSKPRSPRSFVGEAELIRAALDAGINYYELTGQREIERWRKVIGE